MDHEPRATSPNQRSQIKKDLLTAALLASRAITDDERLPCTSTVQRATDNRRSSTPSLLIPKQYFPLRRTYIHFLLSATCPLLGTGATHVV